MIMRMPASEVRVIFGEDERMQRGEVMTARIKARPGLMRPQRKGAEGLTKMLQEIQEAESYKELEKWGGIATGYANALCDIDLVSKRELADIIGVIDRAGWKAMERIEAVRHPFWSRIKRKLVSV